MLFASAFCQGVAINCFKLSKECHDNMTYHEIIHVPSQCQLLPIDNLICDTGVIRVDDEAHRSEL
jgi:hypothetical protein